jgi:hypothetical protein
VFLYWRGEDEDEMCLSRLVPGHDYTSVTRKGLDSALGSQRLPVVMKMMKHVHGEVCNCFGVNKMTDLPAVLVETR